MSIPYYWPDEFAFIRFNDVIYKAAAPAISTVSEIAERDGRPHGKIISTTPANIDNPAGAFCKSLIDNACPFIEEMYDWSRDRIKEYINANSSNSFLYIRYTWQQLGLSKEWYDKMCRELVYDWLIIKREVDLVWTKSSDNSVFSEAQLDILAESVITETSTKVIDVVKINRETGVKSSIPYAFTLIKPLEKDKCYFIGSDIGGGLGRDFSTLVITDPQDNFKEVAIFKSNVINIHNFTELVRTLLVHHLPNSAFFPENNSYGKAVIDTLLDDPRVAKRIYYEYKLSDKDKTKPNPSKVTDTIQYGINTNAATRQLMIDIIKEIVEEEPSSIVSEAVYNDIKGLIYTKSGKVEHDLSTHDDCMFGKLMVLYAVRYGNNIAKFLRDANKTKRTEMRAAQLVAKPNSNIALDPVFNKGIEVDLKDLLGMMETGLSIEEAKVKMLEHSSSKGKKQRNVDKTLLNSVLR